MKTCCSSSGVLFHGISYKRRILRFLVMVCCFSYTEENAAMMQSLMSLGLEKAMLLISSYSNPVETLEHARLEGYILQDFMLTSMPFGTYSSEPKVDPLNGPSCIQAADYLPWVSCDLRVLLHPAGPGLKCARSCRS